MSGEYLHRGTSAFRRASIALFACGFTTFALLYCVQPLLPQFTREFAVSPAVSSLAVSSATIGLALSLIAAGIVSDRLGRKPVMTVSLLAVTAGTIAVAFAPNWPALLVLRFLTGAAISGVPAVAMAYLAEEIEPSSLGAVMGLYVAGTAVGGMAGRMLTGIFVDVTGSWRWSVALMGLTGLVAALVFIRFLPPSRRFASAPMVRFSDQLRGLAVLFREPTLPWIFACGFLLMGSFVALFNLLTYRLTAAPFNLSNAMVGAIFVVYLFGARVSVFFGRLSDRYGRSRILAASAATMLTGVLLTLPNTLWLIVPGLSLVTAGFFGAHAMASAWAGTRVPAARGLAASLYLFFYYCGPVLSGALAGRQWTVNGWPGVVAVIGGMQLLLLVITLISPLRKDG